MSQATEHQPEVSIDQSLMINKIVEIVDWMHRYESPDKGYTTQTNLPKSQGYCYALRTVMINAALVDYEKRKIDQNYNESRIDEIYNALHAINSASLPPENPKAFYHEVNPFILTIHQMQSDLYKGLQQSIKGDLKISKDSNTQDLNLNAPLIQYPDTRKISYREDIHTYFFDKPEKLLEWGQKATLGDALICDMRNTFSKDGGDFHALCMYTKIDKDGELVVGFYDPNQHHRIEIKQSELKSIEDLGEFNPFRQSYIDKSLNREPLVIATHVVIASEAMTRQPPEISDNELTAEQRKYALLAVKGYSAAKECNKAVPRLFAKQIEQCTQGDKEAIKEMFSVSSRYFQLLKDAGLDPNIYIKQYAQLPQEGDKEAEVNMLQFCLTAEAKDNIDAANYTKDFVEKVRDTNDPSMMSSWIKAIIGSKNLKQAGLELDEAMITKCIELSDSKNDLGKYMLCWAASTNRTDVIDQLIAKQVDVNGRVKGRAPLFYAGMVGKEEAFKVLIANKADVNQTFLASNDQEKSLLSILSWNPFADDPNALANCAIQLIKAGAYIEPSMRHENLLELYKKDPTIGLKLVESAICDGNNDRMCQLLSDTKIDINSKLYGTTTLLEWAGLSFMGRNTKCLEALLDLGANAGIEMVNHPIRFIKDLQIAAKLFYAGGPLLEYKDKFLPHCKDNPTLAQGMFFAAVREGKEDLVDELLKTGHIDVNTSDKFNKTAIDYAQPDSKIMTKLKALQAAKEIIQGIPASPDSKPTYVTRPSSPTHGASGPSK